MTLYSCEGNVFIGVRLFTGLVGMPGSRSLLGGWVCPGGIRMSRGVGTDRPHIWDLTGGGDDYSPRVLASKKSRCMKLEKLLKRDTIFTDRKGR